MYTRGITSAFEAVVLLSTIGGAAASAWIFRDPAHAPCRRARVAWLFHPLAQLLLVCTLFFLNQILCHAYVLRVHGGDATFITRFLGPGWFARPRWESVRFVAAHIGDGRWLAPTVLRVQAFLELPFTLFAYLAVARMLGRELHLRLVRPPLLLLASASFSITFS